MKIKIINDDDMYLYVFDEIDILNFEREELTSYIKSLLLKLKNIYKIILHGFYEIIIYPHRVVNVIKISNIDQYVSKSIDLRIIISDEKRIYLKFDEFTCLKDYLVVLTDKKHYYLLADDIKKEDIVKLADFYDIILESDLDFSKLKEISITYE